VAIEDFFTTPVTIVTPGTKADRYNEADVIPVWDNPIDSQTSNGWLVQIASQEVLDGRDAQVTRWRLFLPATAAITSMDRVLLDAPEYELPAIAYEVDGVPDVVSTPSGPHHTEVLLRLVAG
jgi:hypothetical protein